MIEFHDHIVVPGGKERDILVLGVSWQYLYVRNLEVLAGRFFDDSDTQARNKVAIITAEAGGHALWLRRRGHWPARSS